MPELKRLPRERERTPSKADVPGGVDSISRGVWNRIRRAVSLESGVTLTGSNLVFVLRSGGEAALAPGYSIPRFQREECVTLS